MRWEVVGVIMIAMLSTAAVAVLAAKIVTSKLMKEFRLAALFANPLNLNELPGMVGAPVAVTGRPEPIRQFKGPRGEPVLWFREEYLTTTWTQDDPTDTTVASTEENMDFLLHFEGGGRVQVRCKPTKIELMRKYESFATRPNQGYNRRVRSWLPMVSSLTVTGRLELDETGGRIVPDPQLGMIFTERPPGREALRCWLRGGLMIAGIAALFAGWALILVLLVGD